MGWVGGVVPVESSLPGRALLGNRARGGLGPVLPQASVAQLVYAVGKRRRLGIVGGEQHCGTALAAELGEQFEHLAAALRVEVARRLVGQHQLRLGRERLGEQHPLALAH